MEKIFFLDSNGHRISGILSDPGSEHIVLICHGLGASKDSSRYKILQDRLNKLDIATFRIDFLGHGESQGNYEDLTLTEAIDDVLKAKEFLKNKGYTHIGFVGSSFGGVAGIMAASRDNDFRYLVLISPPSYYNIKEMVVSSIYVLRELRKFHDKKAGLNDKRKSGPRIKFFRDYGSHDSYDAASKIDIPALIIQGDKDNIVPIEKSIELHKHMKNSYLKIIKGAGHQYSKTQDRLIDEVMKFIEKNIG